MVRWEDDLQILSERKQQHFGRIAMVLRGVDDSVNCHLYVTVPVPAVLSTKEGTFLEFSKFRTILFQFSWWK